MNEHCAAVVLGVCGFSGAGKTTLLEAAIPILIARGLKIAVIKHDAHGVTVDKPGKDSDRFFRAGATVALGAPGEQFERRHAPEPLELLLARLGREHDLVLVEGHKQTPLPKLWLHGPDGEEIPAGVSNVLCALDRQADRLAALLKFLDRYLPEAWSARPIYGGVLVGGKSSRMGAPKQLLPVQSEHGQETMGEIVAGAISCELGAERMVALGSGALPEKLAALPRLADAPGIGGPAAAMIAAHRWAPEAAWVFSACDHPALASRHIRWLREQRSAGVWAVVPKQSDGHPCPTLALYEPQALELLEQMAHTPNVPRAAALLERRETRIVDLPAELAEGWLSVNTPEELRDWEQRSAAQGLARAQDGER